MNDLKKEFNNRTSEHITRGIKELIDIVRSTKYGPKMQESPPILIVSIPIPVETNCENVLDMFAQAKERAQHLGNDLKALVSKYDEKTD